MTDEQINIAIAGSLGWTYCKAIPRKPKYWQVSDVPEVVRIGSRPPHWGAGSCTFPNYCNDLNAIHEAELATFKTGGAWGEYFDYLSIVCDLANDPITATARQRAEALLKTIGKWE